MLWRISERGNNMLLPQCHHWYRIPVGVLCFRPLRFHQRPTLVLVSANQKHSEEEFCVYKKKAKIESSAQPFLVNRHRGSVHPRQQEWSCQASSLELKLSISASDARAQTASVNICDSAPFISCIREQDVSKVTAL